PAGRPRVGGLSERCQESSVEQTIDSVTGLLTEAPLRGVKIRDVNRLIFAGVVFAMWIWVQTASAQQSCESLTGLKLPHTTITSSAMIPEGPFAVPGPL